ncbi:MAG TPA: MASE1 domain-containing protein [Steroidobacteraceae bacterium]|jgi:signal transduction histidine kinase|nr:MASE1 domain-containing protein [Steroidobacteraceae bacterium]
MPIAPDADRPPGLQWEFRGGGIRKAAASLGAFAVLYALLVLLGLKLHENVEELTIVWPAAGLLFMALWLSPRRNWIWILAIQLAVELSAGAAFRSETFHIARYSLFAAANSIDGIVGALVASQLIATPRIPRLRNVLLFIASVAIGAAASAIVGAFGSTRTFGGGGAEYVREWQIWWAGNWLGSLCIAPIVMGWAVRLRARQHSAPAGPAVEMMLIAFAMLAMTSWVFSAPPGGATTILDMPFVLLALVVVAAFRMPPRWSTCLAAAGAILVAYFASRGLGPFAGDPSPFVRVGAVQLYLAALVVINFLLTVVLLEKRNAYQLLRTSDERYRNFIEHSSEAVWRIELSEALDPNLPVADQIAWLQIHAHVAESNLSYLQLNMQMGLSELEARQWRADMPWFAMFIDHLGAAASQGYSMDGLQFSISGNSHPRTFITGFRGVIEQGRLVRVWGVARDVTELVALNERLRHNQERLKLYARELVGAEERARRSTAVDLHDGIGQQLVGLSMTLDALMGRSPPEIRLLLSEATSTVREVQSIAQRVIADLSPPGLYELGLEPALKWLSVYMRGKDNLLVELKVTTDEASVDIELRVLVFKVIRELLRNVVKHSGVQAATVTVSRSHDELRAVVEDRGVGFEWQLSLFEPRAHGFGLWSVADRVRDAAGEMSVDTGPGRGCRVTVVFPLEAARRPARKTHSSADGGAARSAS